MSFLWFFFGVCYFDVSVKPAALFTFLFLQVMITTFQTETKEAVFWNKASSQHKRKSTTTTLKQWNVGDEENHLVTVTASCWQSQAKYYKIVYIDPVWFNHRLRDKSTIHMSRFIIHQNWFLAGSKCEHVLDVVYLRGELHVDLCWWWKIIHGNLLMK